MLEQSVTPNFKFQWYSKGGKKLIANKTSELKLKSYHKASKRLTAKKESLVGQSFMCMSV